MDIDDKPQPQIVRLEIAFDPRLLDMLQAILDAIQSKGGTSLADQQILDGFTTWLSDISQQLSGLATEVGSINLQPPSQT
jgi:hypothetical protein